MQSKFQEQPANPWCLGLYSLPVRLRSFFHPNKADEETKEELRAHLEQQIDENIAFTFWLSQQSRWRTL